jgi:hypothetical protein
MGCKTLTPPEPPEIDASKLSNVSLPDGVPSVDALKAKAQNPGISDKLKAAGDGITSNIKDEVSGFTPTGIADKVKGVVTGIIGGITDQITGVIDGAKKAFNNIKNFKPGHKKLNNPSAAFAAAKAKGLSSNLAKIGDRQNLRASALCGNKFNQEAGKVNNNINSKVNDFTKGLTSSDKRKMKTDPTFAQGKVDEGVAKTTAEVQTETEAAVIERGLDKVDRDIQSKIQSAHLETITASDECAAGYTLNLLKCMDDLLLYSFFWYDHIVKGVMNIHKSSNWGGGDGYSDAYGIGKSFVEQHVREKLIAGLKTLWENTSGCDGGKVPSADAIWPPSYPGTYTNVITAVSRAYTTYWDSPTLDWTREQMPKKGTWWKLSWTLLDKYFSMWEKGYFTSEKYRQYAMSDIADAFILSYPEGISEFEKIVKKDEFHHFQSLIYTPRAEALGLTYEPYMIVLDMNMASGATSTPWPSNFIVTATFGKDGIVKNIKTDDPDPFLQSLDWS